MFPLSLATIGEQYSVLKVTGDEEVRHFLSNLGFVEDAKVELVSTLDGDVIVNIKDSRIAVNKDMAKHILIK